VQGFAYLNLGNSNGGSVVDVSEGGLGFRAVAPVRRNGTIALRFSERNHRIEADGELAWIDATEKGGGVRFTVLPSEAREQIRRWVSETTTLPGTNGKSAPSALPPRAVPVVDAMAPEIQALPGFARPFAGLSPETKVQPPLRGFSGGLVTGLMVSAVLAVAVLFPSYRREIGQSLIRLGERFAGSPQAQTQTAPPTQQEALLPAPQTVVPARPSPLPAKESTKPAPEAAVKPERIAPQTPANPVQPARKIVPTEVADATPPAAVIRYPAPPPASGVAASHAAAASASHPTEAPAGGSTAPATAPAVSLPTTMAATGPNVNPSKPATVPRVEPANGSVIHAETPKQENVRSTAEMFFEVAKFKDEVSAESTRDRLAQLGFPTSQLQQGRLWMNSYHVLVGPYGADDEAKSARKKLSKSGFAPRAFRRGSRSLTVLSGLTLNGATMPAGDYTISWESYVTDAAVKVANGNKVVANADGKWVKRPVRYPHDAYMYRRNSDGSQTLLEIRFAGMNQALVFGKSS
jgi:cell division protein FtsN